MTYKEIQESKTRLNIIVARIGRGLDHNACVDNLGIEDLDYAIGILTQKRELLEKLNNLEEIYNKK